MPSTDTLRKILGWTVLPQAILGGSLVCLGDIVSGICVACSEIITVYILTHEELWRD